MDNGDITHPNTKHNIIKNYNKKDFITADGGVDIILNYKHQEKLKETCIRGITMYGHHFCIF